MSNTCAQCRFHHSYSQCRRHAPTISLIESNTSLNKVWPITNSDDSCGDFEQRKKWLDLEPRYLVMKMTDVSLLTNDEQAGLRELQNRVNSIRFARGKSLLDWIVIERDWPEFQPTFELLAERMGI